MGQGAVTRAGLGALAVAVAVSLACVLLSLDRGLELADESGYIYLLGHPETVLQFLDHRLWGLLDGTVVFYRFLALLLVTASAAFLAAGAVGASGVRARAALFVHLATLAGAFGYFAVIRPTMNYGTSALVFGNLFVGLLLHDLPRASGGWWQRVVPVLLGGTLALLALGRFTAVPAYLLILFTFVTFRPGRPAARVVLVAATLLAAALSVAMLEAAGFQLCAMVAFGTSLTGASHRLGGFVPRDLLLIALMAGIGVAGALAVRLAGRWGLSRSAAFVSLVLAMLAAAVADQRAVFVAQGPGPSPFDTNVNLYGTTYVFYAVAALFAGMLALDDVHEGRAAWSKHARLWGVLVLLGLACACPFLGTNTGILARSGLNAGPLFAAIAVAGVLCAERGLLAGWAVQTTIAGCAAVMALFVFANSIWSPYGVHGGWGRQTQRLSAPASLAGLHVSPGTAALARDVRTGLARSGFDARRDRLLFAYGRPGLAVLAGGDIAGLPFAGSAPEGTAMLCGEIAGSITTTRPRRLYGLDLDYRPALIRCLARHGIDLGRARVERVSPLVTITVVPLS